MGAVKQGGQGWVEILVNTIVEQGAGYWRVLIGNSIGGTCSPRDVSLEDSGAPPARSL